MAIIGKIRERLGLLIVIIVGLAIASFILGDILNPGKSFMGGGRNELAKINGEEITPQEFEHRVEKVVEMFKAQYKDENVDQSMLEMFRDQAWTQLISETVLNEQYEKTGVTVCTEELWDMVQGRFVHPKIKEVPAFQDTIKHQFNPVAAAMYAKRASESEGEQRDQWLAFEEGIRKERLAQKYINLLKHGLYITTHQTKADHAAKNRFAKVKYLLLNYNTMSDSTITVSESEVKSYYKQHENEYKQEASRKVDYVTWDVLPSDADRTAAQEDIMKMHDEFAKATNDSEFVVRNADSRSMDNTYHKKGTLSAMIDSVMFSASVGTIVGPYLENEVYKLAKLSDVKTTPDSVKARHILLKVEAGEDTLKVRARADSLKKIIKAKKNFEELAKQLSEDPGSGQKGGDLGWFKEGAMVPPFNDACFNGKKGDMPIVTSQFGVHLIEVLDIGKSSKKVKVAIVDNKIEASTQTDREIYAKANAFASKYNTGELFDKGVISEKLNKRIADNLKENDKTISGLDSPRELVRWAYKAKKDEISKIFQLGNKYVLARLNEIREKGNAPLEQVKEQVEVGAKKDKKAQLLMDKFTANNASTIDELAKKMNLQVQIGEHISFASPVIPGVGKESEIVGNVFALKPNVLSKPLKGNLGVYILMLEQFIEPPAVTDYTAEKKQMQASFQQRADYDAFNALKEKADIIDNRAKFY